jgi:hypothetical protein
MPSIWEFRFFIHLELNLEVDSPDPLSPLNPILQRIAKQGLGTLLSTAFDHPNISPRTDTYYGVQSTSVNPSAIGLKLRGSKKLEIKTLKATVPGLKSSLEKWKKESLSKSGQTEGERNDAVTAYLVGEGMIPMGEKAEVRSDSNVAVTKRRLDQTLSGCLVTIDKLGAVSQSGGGEIRQSPWFSMSIESASPVDCQTLMHELGVMDALEQIEANTPAGTVVFGGYPSFVSHLLKPKPTGSADQAWELEQNL